MIEQTFLYNALQTPLPIESLRRMTIWKIAKTCMQNMADQIHSNNRENKKAFIQRCYQRQATSPSLLRSQSFS